MDQNGKRFFLCLDRTELLNLEESSHRRVLESILHELQRTASAKQPVTESLIVPSSVHPRDKSNMIGLDFSFFEKLPGVAWITKSIHFSNSPRHRFCRLSNSTTFPSQVVMIKTSEKLIFLVLHFKRSHDETDEKFGYFITNIAAKLRRQRRCLFSQILGS